MQDTTTAVTIKTSSIQRRRKNVLNFIGNKRGKKVPLIPPIHILGTLGVPRHCTLWEYLRRVIIHYSRRVTPSSSHIIVGLQIKFIVRFTFMSKEAISSRCTPRILNIFPYKKTN